MLTPQCHALQLKLTEMAYSFSVQFLNVLFDRVVTEFLQDFLPLTQLKEKQKLCLQYMAEKHDVFGIIWTGFSMRLFFQLLPHVLKDTSYLRRCPSEKNLYLLSHYISVESLINVVFDKNIILATLSVAKTPEAGTNQNDQGLFD